MPRILTEKRDCGFFEFLNTIKLFAATRSISTFYLSGTFVLGKDGPKSTLNAILECRVDSLQIGHSTSSAAVNIAAQLPASMQITPGQPATRSDQSVPKPLNASILVHKHHS